MGRFARASALLSRAPSADYIKYPTETTFTPDSGTQQLNVVMDVNQTAVLTDEFPYPRLSTSFTIGR